jgi:hypothetical protein
MTLKASTGLRNKMLDTGSLKATFAAGFIRYYKGSVPADADAAISSESTNVLCTLSISAGGTGINFDTAAAAGVLAKAPAEAWQGVVGNGGGVATFYRHYTATEAGGTVGGSSTTLARLQGSIAAAGGDLNLTNTTLANGATETLDYYVVGLPTL